MTRYTLHYNSRCQDCVKLAEWNRRLDWLGRFERTVTPSPIGIPDVGDIHVVDHQEAKVFTGAYATQRICQNIPAYWPIALLMRLPFVFNQAVRQKPGCNGESCVTQ